MSARPRVLLFAVLLALVAAAAFVAFRYMPGTRAAAPKAPTAVPVSVAQVVQKSVPVTLHAIGNVEPYTSVAVKARVDGQIVAVRFREGDEVRQGAVLFEIDRRPFDAQLAQAQANQLKDQALLTHARDQDRRYKDLLDRRFISADAYAQMKTNVATAEATVRADEAAIAGIRLQLDYCTIHTPITGYAGKIQIQEGNLVKANDTNPLVVINQVVPVNVSFAVPEQQLADVRKFQADGELRVTASFANGSGAPLAGKLSFVDNTTDVTTGTIRLKAEFANTDKTLWPGQFVNVALTLTQQKDAVTVPSTAIQNGPNGQYVFVVSRAHTVELRDVKVARSEGSVTVIASGLIPGETVVTVGQLRLAPGVEVALSSGAGV
jgi:multidrug efflux system membrane fusion protein